MLAEQMIWQLQVLAAAAATPVLVELVVVQLAVTQLVVVQRVEPRLQVAQQIAEKVVVLLRELNMPEGLRLPAIKAVVVAVAGLVAAAARAIAVVLVVLVMLGFSQVVRQWQALAQHLAVAHQ